MKKLLVILILSFLAISQISFAVSLDYKGLEKLSKNNTFMDDKGIPYPDDKIKGAIAFNPAFAGPKSEWQKKYPQWGEFRKHQVNIIKSTNSLKGIIFSHAKDNFEDPETLAFFKEFDALTFIDYSEVNCGNAHSMPGGKCFTEYVKENNYLVTFLESIF